ncbi:MAG: hypothetical protein ACRDPM_02905 [Solirubrobacteraceae bacterium]
MAVLGAALPIAAYLVLREVLHSDGYALAVSALIPLATILARSGTRRRFGLVAAVVTVVLVIALTVSIASGGSALPLKLRRAAITGPLGIACLASVVVRRPLLPALLALLPTGRPALSRLESWRLALTGEPAFVLTAIVGLTLVCDALLQVVLALVVSTTTFVAITGLVRLAIAAVGLVVCAGYVRFRWRRPATPQAAGDPDAAALATTGSDRP